MPTWHRQILEAMSGLLLGMFVAIGTSVFLSQHMQIARGKSPTESGLLTIPIVIGLFAASTVIGRRVSRTGRYNPYMLAGTILLTLGLTLMGTLDETTSLVELGAFMVLVGAGLGMLMQNLVLVVQNAMHEEPLGTRSGIEIAREAQPQAAWR